jgi:hypothetical protein
MSALTSRPLVITAAVTCLVMAGCGSRAKIVRDPVPLDISTEEAFQKDKDDRYDIKNSTDASFGSTTHPYAKTYAGDHAIKRIAIIELIGQSGYDKLRLEPGVWPELAYAQFTAALQAEGFTVIPLETLSKSKAWNYMGAPGGKKNNTSKQARVITGIGDQIRIGNGGEWLSNMRRETGSTDASGNEVPGIDAIVRVVCTYEGSGWASKGWKVNATWYVPNAKMAEASAANGLKAPFLPYNHALLMDDEKKIAYEIDDKLHAAVIESELAGKLQESIYDCVRVFRDHCGYPRPADSEAKIRAYHQDFINRVMAPARAEAAAAAAKP